MREMRMELYFAYIKTSGFSERYDRNENASAPGVSRGAGRASQDGRRKGCA
jgi:hypothetical protein